MDKKAFKRYLDELEARCKKLGINFIRVGAYQGFLCDASSNVKEIKKFLKVSKKLGAL